LVTQFIAETPNYNVDVNQLNAVGESAQFQYLSFTDTVMLQANTPYWITIQSNDGTNHLPIAMSHPADLYTSWIKNDEGYFYLSQIPLIRIQSCMDTGNANPDTTTFIPNVQEKLLQLYPNPTEDVLFIQGLQQGVNYTYFIVDIAGRKIMENQLTGNQKIDVALLKAGCYQLVLLHEEKRTTFSFMKK
jgi:hypothetical protein